MCKTLSGNPRPYFTLVKFLSCELLKIQEYLSIEMQFVQYMGYKTVIPQYTHDEFKTFTKQNGIHHMTFAPYHPASNGLAKRVVQTFNEEVYWFH